MQGFNPAEVKDCYGDTLTIWDWHKREPIQQIRLGAEGLIPLELRFLHDPAKAHAFVGAALSSNIIHITKVRRSFAPGDPGCLGKRLLRVQTVRRTEGLYHTITMKTQLLEAKRETDLTYVPFIPFFRVACRLTCNASYAQFMTSNLSIR